MSAVRLSASVEAAIRRHAAETYPNECCGALIGESSLAAPLEIRDALALANVTDEGPRRRFRVSAEDYRQSEAYADRSGAELVGFYHSHPDHPAVPSQYDLDHAWPNLSYVIVAVVAGATGDLRSWRLRADRSAFEEELQS
jgi:proteasome lid subunit RPN8/RPN11